MLEKDFQKKLIKDIKHMFPGCVVIKNDPTYMQGIPDLLVLYRDKWGALECKRTKNARKQPNQTYYVEKMARMSFCAFIHPDNKEDVLYDLQRALQS